MGYTKADFEGCFDNPDRMTYEQFVTAMSGAGDKAVGALRVSVGVATNFADVYRLMHFLHSFLDQPADNITAH
jgi:selenocysteine lyase/cysteine desulfurase